MKRRELTGDVPPYDSRVKDLLPDVIAEPSNVVVWVKDDSPVVPMSWEAIGCSDVPSAGGQQGHASTRR